jgi:hypothetical protein
MQVSDSNKTDETKYYTVSELAAAIATARAQERQIAQNRLIGEQLGILYGALLPTRCFLAARWLTAPASLKSIAISPTQSLTSTTSAPKLLMQAPKLNPEQLNALINYAHLIGRKWKSELNYAWMSGNYPSILRDDACYLQQVRNTFGPSWLISFKLPK